MLAAIGFVVAAGVVAGACSSSEPAGPFDGFSPDRTDGFGAPTVVSTDDLVELVPTTPVPQPFAGIDPLSEREDAAIAALDDGRFFVWGGRERSSPRTVPDQRLFDDGFLFDPESSLCGAVVEAEPGTVLVGFYPIAIGQDLGEVLVYETPDGLTTTVVVGDGTDGTCEVVG